MTGRRVYLLVILSILVMLKGCSLATNVANRVAEPETTLILDPAVDINPDSNRRPSPLVVRIYELSDRNRFETAEFFSLYDDDRAVLGESLLSSVDLVLLPGHKQKHVMSLDSKTRYVGVMAEFRDIENATWRALPGADPRGYDTIRISVDGLTLKRVD